MTEILAPTGSVAEGVIEASTVFALRGDELVATGGYPAKRAKFDAAGLDPAVVLAR